MREHADIVDAIEVYSDTVVRVCSLYLSQEADRDDAFQDTFLKYAQYDGVFNGEEHRKAWLIRVAANVCKDCLRRVQKREMPLDSLDDQAQCDERAADEGMRRVQASELVSALNGIDEKYRIVLFLKYYEGYTAAQIGAMLDMPENTVYTDLARGRKKLKEVLANGARD